MEENDFFDDMTEEEAWHYLENMFDVIPAAVKYEQAMKKGDFDNSGASVNYQLSNKTKE